MSSFETIILAIIEGLTEFLPVSSTGHMILAQAFLKIPASTFVKMFLINIQFGAILAVVVTYIRRFFNDFDFYYKLIIAFIPAAIIGFLLNDYIDSMLESVTTVAISLILGGAAMVIIDKYFDKKSPSEVAEEAHYDEFGRRVLPPVSPLKLTYLQSLIIGFFQCIAMVPGVSRAAATIIGGLTQGLTKKEAAEFSFFLAVPTIAAAAGYKTLKGIQTIHGDHLTTLVLGNVIAFIVAFITIRYFIDFVSKHGLKLFGYYRIILGFIILFLIYIFHYPLEIN